MPSAGESENSGLDHWTGLDYWTVWEGHNNPAEFLFRVMELKFKVLGSGAGHLSSYMSVGNFDNHEKGLCGRLGNSLWDHVQKDGKHVLYNCDLHQGHRNRSGWSGLSRTNIRLRRHFKINFGVSPSR